MAVSKPSWHDHDAGELGKAVKEEGIIFVVGDKPSKRLQPDDGAFNNPAITIAAKCTAILRSGAHTPLAMRANKLNPAICQAFPEWVAICCSVID